MMMMMMMMMEGDNKRLNYNTHTAKQQIYFRESYNDRSHSKFLIYEEV